MIANLFSNAIKYTETGGAIDVRFRDAASTCSISISDTGIGISKQEQEQIFDRFYQADSSDTRRSEGVGIGLALVKDFVNLHRGELTVESKKGEGSCFTIILKKGNGHFSKDDLENPEAVEGSLNENEDVFTKTNRFSEIQEVQSNSGQAAEHEEISADTDVTSVMIVEDNDDLRDF